MVIIKGDIVTKNVSSIIYNSSTRKTEVTFNNGRKYSYIYSNVIWLKDPKVLNPKLYRIYIEKKELTNVDAIYVFGHRGECYWHIIREDGSEWDYSQEELTIDESCLINKQSKNVFEYLCQISEMSNLRNKDTGEKMLKKKYEQIDFLSNKTALARYVNPSMKYEPEKKSDILIFPFGCNNSQYKAVKNAMENQVSVIQGPPGTGKTQTILNIIANIIMQEKTVQIVSNNNSATENVYEKLEKYRLEFIAASLGNSEKKSKFINSQSEKYPDFTTWFIPKEGNNYREDIKNKSRYIGELFKKQEKLALLKQELAQVDTEIVYFNVYLDETAVSIDSIAYSEKCTAEQWLELWQQCQSKSEKSKKLGILNKLKMFFKFGLKDFSFYKQEISQIITTFQAFYYKTKKKEIQMEIEEIENYLGRVNKNSIEDFRLLSMIILKDKLANSYKGKKERKQFAEKDLWINPRDVLKEYPVILSTTFSSTSSLNKETKYNYLIIDEASQVDVATGALALSCAENVVIVGDIKQLPNVVTKEDKQKADAIFDSFKLEEGYHFAKSFLQSILEVIPNVKQVMLREHYRCHPKIINFCNQKYYRGELIIMTEDNGEDDVLAVVKTVEGNHARSHYSQRQIDIIKNEVIPKYVKNNEETGIIAPYNNQVFAIKNQIPDIDTATVHKFQGKEKDTIIISTVDDEITDFADDPYLINVAVSRAKRKLILVVTGNENIKDGNISDLIEYIRYNNFEVTESKIYSVFDYLYQQYTEKRMKLLKKSKKISEYDSENLMFVLLSEILTDDKYASLAIACHFPMNMLIRNLELLNEQECEYVMNLATHLDFLIYNRISKKPVLAVEVDGYKYHKEGTKQSERDKMKNHILELYEIPIIRLSTNGSNEKQRIISKLDKI